LSQEEGMLTAKRRAPVLAALVAVVFLALALVGCGGRGRVERRLLVVGIDGAEWSVVTPLLERGKLPNLSRLIESGAACGLRSLEPKQKSPVIWTTIATGKYPDKHGISDYIDASGGRILTSNVRTARTFWDILGEDGRKVTVIGWLRGDRLLPIPAEAGPTASREADVPRRTAGRG
jgi:hypothetical protein